MIDRKEQILACIKVIEAIAEVIDEAGPTGVPSGHIYASLMGKMSIDTYMQLITLLVDAKRIRVSNHVCYSTRVVQ